MTKKLLTQLSQAFKYLMQRAQRSRDKFKQLQRQNLRSCLEFYILLVIFAFEDGYFRHIEDREKKSHLIKTKVYEYL